MYRKRRVRLRRVSYNHCAHGVLNASSVRKVSHHVFIQLHRKSCKYNNFVQDILPYIKENKYVNNIRDQELYGYFYIIKIVSKHTPNVASFHAMRRKLQYCCTVTKQSFR